jgi:heme exporter protein D
MELWVWVLIAAFVVSDLIIATIVVRAVRRKKADAQDPHSGLARDIGLE